MQTTTPFLSFFEEIDINVELKERSVVQDPVVYHKLTSSKCNRFNLLVFSYVISVRLLPNVYRMLRPSLTFRGMLSSLFSS